MKAMTGKLFFQELILWFWSGNNEEVNETESNKKNTTNWTVPTRSKVPELWRGKFNRTENDKNKTNNVSDAMRWITMVNNDEFMQTRRDWEKRDVKAVDISDEQKYARLLKQQ